MKNLFLLLLLFGFLFSCKKESSDTGGTPSSVCKIQAISTISGKKRITYEYTADNKVSRIQEYDTTSGMPANFTVFAYSPASVAQTYFYKDGSSVIEKRMYILDVHGNAVKRYRQRNSYDTASYEYDSNGYLSKAMYHSTDPISGGYLTTTYVYSNGAKTYRVRNSGSSIDSLEYEYYDFSIAKEVKPFLFVEDDEIEGYNPEEDLFLGKTSDLALKSTTLLQGTDRDHLIQARYSYEFNSDKTISKLKGALGYQNNYDFHIFENQYVFKCN